MSSPIPTSLVPGMSSGRATTTTADSLPCCRVTTDSGKLFKDILADEDLLSDVMDELKEILPEDVYAQIEEMVNSGNGLPLAAIFSPESPLFDQEFSQLPKMLQDAIKLGGSLTLPNMDSASRVGGESLRKSGTATVGDRVDNISRQISEALANASDNAVGSSLGKKIQALLLAAKAESAADAGQNALASTVGSTTQTATVNSAISGLAQLSNFQASGGSPMPPAIAAPLGNDAAWGQAMGDRVMWMVGKGVQSASIRINPPELGPVQVQLSVHGDQASVSMLVQNGVVKEALDAAIPRLREMLGESNLNLVNVDVSHRENPDQSSSSAMRDHGQRGQMGHSLGDQDETVIVGEESPRYYYSRGLLDDYA